MNNNVKRIDMNKIKGKNTKYITSEEALKDVTPYVWGKSALAEKK